MKKSILILAAIAAVSASVPASAGKWHYGTATTRTAAKKIAVTAARERAKKTGRCYQRAYNDQCKVKHGKWTCRAQSANHPGTCGHGSWIDHSDSWYVGAPQPSAPSCPMGSGC